MLHIDTLTLGNDFKDNDGNIFKVSSNFSEGNKIFVELAKVDNEPLEPIKE
jgi:hypothetical protein